MDDEVRAPSRVVAWKPPVDGIAEVFHAHIVGYGYPVHCHSTWTVLIIDDGAIRYDLDTRHRGAIGDSVTILPPGVAHDGRPAERFGQFRKRNLYLDGRFLPSDLIGAAVDGSTFRDPALRRSLSHLHDRLTDHPDALDIEARLAVIAERFRWHLAPAGVVAAPAEHGVADRLREYLDANVTRAVALGEAAALLDRSVGHLVRSFRSAFGITPYAYVVGARIERARRRLLAGMPPAEVAVEVGFYDQAHLTRHFTRHVSVPPARYAASGRALAAPGGHRSLPREPRGRS